jgi:hypothetical protein
MSSSTWTPRAVASEATRRRLPLWRAVEAQHLIATRALVDTLAEQELLEAVLEAAKPPLPAAAAGLDYLLATPFRYPPQREGSRFRARTDPGVWYGAEMVRTCCAELGYWRWRFVMDSQGLTRLDGVAHTLLHAAPHGACIDLRARPFVRDAADWRAANDYTATQALARTARSAQIAIIRYASVRDPQHAGCGAVLDCRAFLGSGGVRTRQSWFLTVDRRRASWVRARSRHAESHEFVFA